jgi:predicted Zn finger-like uncharacterized protein
MTAQDYRLPMSELLVAQCPFCQTRFRLSQEHLQAAAGNVRCGACLKVFNATLTVNSAAEPTDAQPTQPTIPPLTQPAYALADSQSTLWIHDDLELDNLDLEALGLDESILEEINPTVRLNDVLPDPPTQVNTTPSSTLASESRDSTGAAEWPDFEAQDPDNQLSQTDDGAGSDPWGLLDNAPTEPQPEKAHQAPDTHPIESESSENVVDDLDLHEDFLASPIARDFKIIESQEQNQSKDTDAHTAHSARDNSIFLQGRPPGAPWVTPFTAEERPRKANIDAPERPEPQIGERVELPDLIAEPVVLYRQPRIRRSRYGPLWILLSVIALLGLPAQALYYNFSTLAHNENSRPYLENLCLLTGCALPPRVNIELIRSSNLMVRAHQEYPNALAIDVILYNRAEFAQPFPVLRMTFNDTRGRELLNKHFRPDEYLGGELAGATLMPPQTPVHVALDMLDPGPEAAGYQLDFLSP